MTASPTVPVLPAPTGPQGHHPAHASQESGKAKARSAYTAATESQIMLSLSAVRVIRSLPVVSRVRRRMREVLVPDVVLNVVTSAPTAQRRHMSSPTPRRQNHHALLANSATATLPLHATGTVVLICIPRQLSRPQSHVLVLPARTVTRHQWLKLLPALVLVAVMDLPNQSQKLRPSHVMSGRVNMKIILLIPAPWRVIRGLRLLLMSRLVPVVLRGRRRGSGGRGRGRWSQRRRSRNVAEW